MNRHTIVISPPSYEDVQQGLRTVLYWCEDGIRLGDELAIPPNDRFPRALVATVTGVDHVHLSDSVSVDLACGLLGQMSRETFMERWDSTQAENGARPPRFGDNPLVYRIEFKLGRGAAT